MKNINLNNQEEYWEINYANKPKMFGLAPSFAAEEALKVFKKKDLEFFFNRYKVEVYLKLIFNFFRGHIWT